jgi:hypothetical protein
MKLLQHSIYNTRVNSVWYLLFWEVAAAVLGVHAIIGDFLNGTILAICLVINYLMRIEAPL